MVKRPMNQQCKDELKTIDQWIKLPPPKNYEEAMRRPDRNLWERATRIELDAFDHQA